jgi:Domain of unknown function (DUF4124)
VQDSAAAPDLTYRCVALAALILLACQPGWSRAGEVYKSVDADGHVVYSDRADTSVPKTVVKVDQPNPENAARTAKEQEIFKAEENQRNKQQAAADAKKAQQDHIRQVQCDGARDHYYALKDARHLYSRDTEGNRVYYNDADADAKREEAKAAMDAACGT